MVNGYDYAPAHSVGGKGGNGEAGDVENGVSVLAGGGVRGRERTMTEREDGVRCQEHTQR